jgi:hypothetical protein
MKISSLFSPVAAAFRAAVLALSKVDGKPGLSVEDFTLALTWVRGINNADGKSNAQKAEWVAQNIINVFGTKLPSWPWIPYAIAWATHQVARRIKLIP